MSITLSPVTENVTDYEETVQGERLASFTYTVTNDASGATLVETVFVIQDEFDDFVVCTTNDQMGEDEDEDFARFDGAQGERAYDEAVREARDTANAVRVQDVEAFVS